MSMANCSLLGIMVLARTHSLECQRRINREEDTLTQWALKEDILNSRVICKVAGTTLLLLETVDMVVMVSRAISDRPLTHIKTKQITLFSREAILDNQDKVRAKDNQDIPEASDIKTYKRITYDNLTFFIWL